MHLVEPVLDRSGGIDARITPVHMGPEHALARSAAREFTSIRDRALLVEGVLPTMDHLGRSVEAGPWAQHRTESAQARAGVITDAAQIQRVNAAADRAWHNRFRLFAIGHAAARVEGRDSLDFGREIASRGWRKHIETVHDAATASVVYPGLIAQMAIHEFVELPLPNFNRIFPRVVGAANLMPGIAQYQIARSQGVGRPGPIANGQRDRFNLFTMGSDTELRWTEFFGCVVEEHYIQSLQAQLPGQPVVGQDAVLVQVRAAMAAAENRMQWAGGGVGKLGFLDMEEVQYKDGGTLPAEGVAVLEKVANSIAELASETKGVFKPDMIILSQYIVRLLGKVMGDGAGGLIAETCFSFLRSKMGPDHGITRVEVAWELDNLRAPGASTTDLDTASDYTGVWIGNSQAVQRVEILPTTFLPQVQGNFVSNVPVVGQVGQPYHVTYMPSIMVRYQKTS